MQKEPLFDYVVATNLHGRFCVPKQYLHRPVPKLLVRGEVYEPETQEYLAELSKTGDIVCGGAFVGDFLPCLDKATRTGGLVHTFEPNPVSLAAARYTVKLNGLKKCVLHDCGVGAVSVTMNLQIAKPNGRAMAARARIVQKAEEGQTIQVQIRPLDELIPIDRTVSAIQIDIEGYEADAIRGAQCTIRKNSPVIIIEAEKTRNQRLYGELLEDLFPDLVYKLDRVIERNAVFIPAA